MDRRGWKGALLRLSAVGRDIKQLDLRINSSPDARGFQIACDAHRRRRKIPAGSFHHHLVRILQEGVAYALRGTAFRATGRPGIHPENGNSTRWEAAASYHLVGDSAWTADQTTLAAMLGRPGYEAAGSGQVVDAASNEALAGSRGVGSGRRQRPRDVRIHQRGASDRRSRFLGRLLRVLMRRFTPWMAIILKYLMPASLLAKRMVLSYLVRVVDRRKWLFAS
jgi:hypothetical protein